MSNSLFTEETTYFVDAILPVPIPRLFSYRVPRDMVDQVTVGARIIVQFGKTRVVTAIIAKIHQTPPENYQAKYILELLDLEPVVTKDQLWLFEWIAEYYLCNIGEVMNVAVPAGLKVSSQSRMQLNPEFDSFDDLVEDEKQLVDLLQTHVSLSYDEAVKFVGEKTINRTIKNLIKNQIIFIYDEIKERYKPKIIKKIRLKRVYEGSEEIFNLIAQLEKNAKQQEVLLAYLNHISIGDLPIKNKLGIEKSLFRAGNTSDSSLKTLVDKGIFEEFEIIVSRFDVQDDFDAKAIHLSPQQELASTQLMEQFSEKDVVLFHGITGSGKTEVYISIIQQLLDMGSQVLMLLPEIALTTQIVVRLKKVFGDKMGVYHSKFSDNERVEVWKGVLDGKFQFVVGVRSAIFLPFTNLGLIIVDEEHETSYKQFDPAPRYHARDVAIMMAVKQHSKVLLGSATPSLESYYQAKQGKYGLVELNQRFGDAQLPDIKLVNLREERKNKTVKNNFSSKLVLAIQETLAKKEQTLIFQNRRGYAPYMNCEECNWIGSCTQCAVSLTYHMYSKDLVCHYCGHHEPAPRVCPACGSNKVITKGVGTEKIEDDLKEFFPEANVQRMDLDTTRTKNAYQTIIEELETGKVDILVGTQMISKGLDFDKVSLVGIFDADKMINFPDFRSAERAFQMITQVSGRAGRRDTVGEVLIQTSSPQNPLLQFIIENDYQGFYEKEILERESYNYPPFSRIIEITVKHPEQSLAHAAAGQLANRLASKLGSDRVLGPEKALVERIRNKFLFEVWIKLEKDKLNIKATKEFLKQEIVHLSTEKEFKTVQFVVNVDAI
jgi:primosomal protein N' (replication factor Y)